jgi:hypothetical protein
MVGVFVFVGVIEGVGTGGVEEGVIEGVGLGEAGGVIAGL